MIKIKLIALGPTGFSHFHHSRIISRSDESTPKTTQSRGNFDRSHNNIILHALFWLPLNKFC
jgi:hypothetical protein